MKMKDVMESRAPRGPVGMPPTRATEMDKEQDGVYEWVREYGLDGTNKYILSMLQSGKASVVTARRLLNYLSQLDPDNKDFAAQLPPP